MKLTINARNMVVTPKITERIEKKTKTMGRYLLPDAELQVKMRREKNGLRVVELTVPMGGGIYLRAEASADDNLYLAIDQALARLEKQIHRHRTKLGKRIKEDAFQAEAPEFMEEEVVEEVQRQVVRRKTFTVRPMSVEDAIVQMELLGHSFFAFVNVETERTNVLYLRKDGDLGLMEPEA